MEHIGIRQLRQRATHYLRQVAAGRSFVVTDRGRPVAELRPLSAVERYLHYDVVPPGLIPPTRPRRDFQRDIRLTGAPLSSILEEDRREGPE